METSAARAPGPDPAVPSPPRPPRGDATTGTLPRVVTHRRTTLVVLAGVAVLSAAALVVGLLSWAP
ncbi:hypothetical protein C1I99_12385, partial [Micromonospora deserti]